MNKIAIAVAAMIVNGYWLFQYAGQTGTLNITKWYCINHVIYTGAVVYTGLTLCIYVYHWFTKAKS